MHKHLIVLFFSAAFVIFPVTAELVQFWPGSGSVGTAGVRDIADGTNERIIFATTNGISIYDGSGEWEILHSKAGDSRGYLEGIPLNDNVLEIEYDHLNNMWLGYNDGIQVYDGYSKPYTILFPDENFFDAPVSRLKRQGKIMWIATGYLGLFYYYDGRFGQVSFGTDDPAGGYINDIAIDYAEGSGYLTTLADGAYSFSGEPEKLSFSKVSGPLISKDMTGIVSSPAGGVVIFNSTCAVLLDGTGESYRLFDVHDLPPGAGSIQDIAATGDGSYIAGTDDGIIRWKDGEVLRHVTGFDGLANSYIKKVFVDNNGRWWFVTKETVGYYYEPGYAAVFPVEIDPVPKGKNATQAAPDVTYLPPAPGGTKNAGSPGEEKNPENGFDLIGGLLKIFGQGG